MSSFNKRLEKLLEARLTRKDLRTDADELVGEPGGDPGVISGEGYNKKRVMRQLRRHEPSAKPIPTDAVSKMSAVGKTARLSNVTTPVAKAALIYRAFKLRKPRGYMQNIPKMLKTWKTNPDAFPPASRMSPDPNNPFHNKYTQLGGRTRNITSILTRNRSAPFITIPASRYAGSAKRFDKFVKSGGYEKVKSRLKTQGRKPRGQDPRLVKAVETAKKVKAAKTARAAEGDLQ